MFKVIFSPDAEKQIIDLFYYIADIASVEIADKYISGLITYCEKLNVFPIRGLLRNDVRLGLRVTNYKKRTVIAFTIDTIGKTVSVLGVFHGGQNYEPRLLQRGDLTE